MGDFKVNQKDIFFILKDQLDYASLCRLPRYKGLNEKTLDLLIKEAINFAKGVVDPLQALGENGVLDLKMERSHALPSLRRLSDNTEGMDGLQLQEISSMGDRAFPT